jgi:6-phosphogluconolactonase/glucosamine-6-phosphate isomerase/deaminase
LFSGGSALKIIAGLEPRVFGKHITIGVLDERYSSLPSISNFAQLLNFPQTEIADRLGAKFIDTRIQSNETQVELAVRFERELRQWHELYQNGQVIVTQGMGTDGHTAGILPYPENPDRFEQLFEAHSWVISYNAAGKNPFPHRITTTITFLRDIVDRCVAFSTGPEKREVIGRVLAETGELNVTPARVLRAMRDVSLYTDIAER